MLDLSNIFTLGNKWLYDSLLKQRNDSSLQHPLFRLDIVYKKDYYENDGPGIALRQLVEYIKLLDFPEFFIYLYTSNKNINQDLDQLNSQINVIPINKNFEKIKQKYNSICVLPWIHFYVNPQGQVGSCCEFDEKHEIGNLNQDQLIDIPNNAKFRKIRQQMIQNKRPAICSACWTAENNNIQSLRQSMNVKFKKYLPLVHQTKDDGTFEEFKLRYLDFRASNVCNLMCRMCSGRFSSKIAQEEKELYTTTQYIELKLNSIEINETLKYIEDNINNIDQVYFAGGEPMIMKEHYQILDLLLKYQKFSVNINYNTNLTTLKYKNIDVIEYWKQFKNVEIGGSIDFLGDQANYFRSGSDYHQIENNYLKIKDYVNFNMSSTIHMINVFNLILLQKHWITKFNLNPSKIKISILKYPKEQSLQVLPLSFKEKATDTIIKHISWLESISGSELLVKQWRDVLQYMNSSDESHLLGEFFRLNDDKDRNRNQSFENVFPEFKELRSHA